MGAMARGQSEGMMMGEGISFLVIGAVRLWLNLAPPFLPPRKLISYFIK